MGISFNASSLLNGNGIDVSSVVQELQAPESGQLTAWKNDLTTLQTQASDINSISTDLSNLQSAVQEFTDPTGVLAQLSATSSESAIVSASVQTGATSGNYSVVVNTLASAGTLYTAALANANTSILPSGQSSGDLKLQIGGSGGTAADIPITAGSNGTLATLAQSINSLSAKDSWGITASVVTDASGARLAIYSQATGSTGALAVSNNTTNLTFEPPVGGTNAEITVNGIPYASTTNTITGATPDVTLDLTSADPATPVQISITPDTNAVDNAVNNFVAEYNTVISDINSQFAVNPSTESQGPLGSDVSLRILQSSLANDAAYTTTDATSTSSGISSLAALGITENNDGTLTVNTSTLNNALTTDPAAVTNFFTNTNSTGFADSFANDLSNLTDPTTGVLASDLASNQSQQTDLTNEIDNFETQLTTQAAALTQEFDRVNAALEEYPFLLQSVTAELGSLTSGSSTLGTTTSTNTTPTAGTPASGSSTSSSSSTNG